MELSVGQPTDTTQAITPWTVNPSTGGRLPWFTFESTIIETSGATAPAWIYYDAGLDEIVIDTATATTPGIYDF